MNFVLCIVVLIAVYWYAGAYSTTLDAVTPGGAADLAGIRAGDTVVAIDGQVYTDWLEVVNAIDSSEGRELLFTVERDGERLDFPVTPVSVDGDVMVGITCRLVHNPVLAIGQAFSTTKSAMVAMGAFIGQLFRGKASSDDVVGVVGIVSMIGEQARYGFDAVAYFMAMISLNLGIVNLLPLPALDGGRILFVLVRLITRDKIGDKAEAVTHAVGMVLLLALMAFLVFRDVNRFIL